MVTVLRVVSSVITVYMLLLFIRIMLTWFSGPYLGKPVVVLNRVTDPYLRLFRGLRFLQTDRIDFSPVAAIIVLVIVLNITNTLAAYGHISVGIVLALVLSAVWSAVFFILAFFILLMAVRFIGLLVAANSVSPFWRTLDVVVHPVLSFFQRKFWRNRLLTYRSGLGISLGIMIVVAVVGRIIISQLSNLLFRLPF